MPKVKICGVTNLEDAKLACDLGAAAIGFVFYKRSPRYVELEQARKIIAALPPFVTSVGVFVNEARERVLQVCRSAGLNVAQLHGDETTEYCHQLNFPYIKVFRIAERFALSQLRPYAGQTFLLDTSDQRQYGGTGRTFNWEFAKQASKVGKVILSGGLKPDNVKTAVETVRPYAVDASSGVEIEPGRKDREKLKAFFHEITMVAQNG